MKFQDPAEADKLMRIQRELDETKSSFTRPLIVFSHDGKKVGRLWRARLRLQL